MIGILILLVSVYIDRNSSKILITSHLWNDIRFHYLQKQMAMEFYQLAQSQYPVLHWGVFSDAGFWAGPLWAIGGWLWATFLGGFSRFGGQVFFSNSCCRTGYLDWKYLQKKMAMEFYPLVISFVRNSSWKCKWLHLCNVCSKIGYARIFHLI